MADNLEPKPVSGIAPELRGACTFSCVQQAAIVLTCAFLGDGGLRLRAAGIAAVVFWAAFMFIVFLRGSKPIKLDLAFVRWSYPLLWLATLILSAFLAKSRVT